MEEIVLTSDTHALILRNKGYKFKHIKTGNIYTLVTKIKSKNNLNGDWYDAFLYVNDKRQKFCRSCESFILNFKAVKDNG